VYEFKKLLFGEDTSRLSSEASTFFNEKGILDKMDNYNIIRIFVLMKSLYFVGLLRGGGESVIA
jgi:hypothetical protein